MDNDTRLLWSPSDNFRHHSNLAHYITWLKETRGLDFDSYHTLWQWSVDNLEDFWRSLTDYFDIMYTGSVENVLSGEQMPGFKWFEGAYLNYAEHVFRRATDQYPAIIFKSETSAITEISWSDLSSQVSSLQQYLAHLDLKSGDSVAAYLPCIPEATVAFLATNSLGGIWASCSPDFGTTSVIDRFKQLKPKLLFVTDGYFYGGKYFDRKEIISELEKSLPSITHVIVIPSAAHSYQSSITVYWDDALKKFTPRELHFQRVPFNTPIWALYSSGTTGLPKAMVHSVGGIVLEQLKFGTFHNDYKPGERCFWYTTTGWMMWNYIHSSLLTGATMVLYDGNPGYPNLSVLWKFAQDLRINHFGTSAGFILANMKANMNPKHEFNLDALRSIGSTGSTLPPEGFNWVYTHIKQNLWLTSMSGGTDVCSAFVGGNPLIPVYEGEIQCRALGCKLEVYDENGISLINEEGEMVITKPMPSMPLFFLNDPDNLRYRESYFEMFPGIWRHGDWIKITAHNGVIIYGRSDATLNRGGVRIGTSEIYRSVDSVSEVKDSLVVCLEQDKGEFWMPLFVVMQKDVPLTSEIKNKISKAIRLNYSPRHVPDEIIEVPDIPYTISGKKTEMPVKKILMGKDPGQVINSGSLKNPASMDFYVHLAKNIFPKDNHHQ